MYTDEVTEAKNTESEEFGLERLHEIAISNRDLSPQVLIDKLLAEFDEFKAQGVTAKDDATIVIIECDKNC